MKMNLFSSVIFMIFISFIIQYFIMSVIMVKDINNINNSLGKLYISFFMAILMGLTEVVMEDFFSNMISWNYYFVLLLLLSISYLFYTMQIGINDKEYLKEMIEHHSMALLTSEEINKKTSNYKVKKLSNDIISSQSQEIDYMKNLLASYNDQNKIN